MKIEIIKDNFECPFSDMIDKSRFEVIKTEVENVWVIKKVVEKGDEDDVAVEKPLT